MPHTEDKIFPQSIVQNCSGISVLLFIPLLFLHTSCKKNELNSSLGKKPEKIIQQPSNSNKTIKLSKDTVYLLANDVIIHNGEQMIIEAGTLVKAGYTITGNRILPAPARNSILVNPGGIIEINGTENEPVIFTSSEKTGKQEINWGGITIEGKSTDNGKSPPFDENDYSATIRYCRIEFASLTLKALGKRSQIENVMVSYASSSSYTFLGGTNNASNLISYACNGLSDFYISNGFTGNLQQLLALRHPFFGRTGQNPDRTIAGIYLQNNSINSNNAIPVTFPKISNLTIIGPNNSSGSSRVYTDTNLRNAAMITSLSSCFAITNSLISGYPTHCWILDDYNTADAIQKRIAGISNSYFQNPDFSTALFLKPGTYPPFQNNEFRSFIFDKSFNNTWVNSLQELGVEINLSLGSTDPLTTKGFVLQKKSKYEGYFQDIFFRKYDFIGTNPSNRWMKPWTNFNPLSTKYN